MKKNANSTFKTVLGALACLVLFAIFIFMKYAPNAPFQDMPLWLLISPLTVPLFAYTLLVIIQIIKMIKEIQDDQSIDEPYN